MKIWKLISGIISILLVLIILLQSFVVGIFNTIYTKLLGSAESSGTVGIVVAVLLLIAGIASIAVRKRETKKAYTLLIVLFELATMIGYAGAGNNTGLVIWATWCFTCFIVAVFGMVKVLKPGITLKKKWWFWGSIAVAIIISAAIFAVPRDNSEKIQEFEKAIKAKIGPREIDSKIIKEAKLVPEDEVDNIYTSPEKYKYKRVVLKGQVYNVTKTQKGIRFDLCSEQLSLEKVSTIYYDDKDTDINDEDNVIVDGVILDKDDVVDINLTYVSVKATNVTKSNYIDVFSPTIKTYEVNKTISQHGYKVTLKKVELADNQTRAYIKVKNKGKADFCLYTPFAKIKQGKKKYYIDGDYILDYPNFLDVIKKGDKVNGIVSFSKIDENQNFTLKIPAGSSKSKQNVNEYTFKIKTQ